MNDFNILKFETYKKYFLNYFLELLRLQRDNVAMSQLAPLSTHFLPWSEYALRPAGMMLVLNEVTLNSYQSLIEFGGGLSTFYLARLLKQQGGHLHTVEHDVEWIAYLMRQLRQEGLEDVVSLVQAPLVATELSWQGSGLPWYDVADLDEALGEAQFDFVLVDGPPAGRAEIRHARYPAAAFIQSRLQERYSLMLDDANRQGEQQILKQWGKQLGIEFQVFLLQGNLAVGRSGHTTTPKLII